MTARTKKPTKKQRAKAMAEWLRANGIAYRKPETPEQFEARLKRDQAEAEQRRLPGIEVGK